MRGEEQPQRGEEQPQLAPAHAPEQPPVQARARVRVQRAPALPAAPRVPVLPILDAAYDRHAVFDVHPAPPAPDTPLLLFWDTETSGFHSTRQPAAIIDIAMVNGESGVAFSSLMHPHGVHINHRAVAVHHITSEMVADALPLSGVWPELLSWVTEQAGGRTVVLCGYNSHKFDAPVLAHDLRRFGLALPERWLFADLFRAITGEGGAGGAPPPLANRLAPIASRKLGEVYRTLFGEALPGAHRALADAVATRRVWLEAVRENPLVTLSTVDAVTAGRLGVPPAPRAGAPVEDVVQRMARLAIVPPAGAPLPLPGGRGPTCQVHGTVCVRRVSHSAKNPGRVYWGCSAPSPQSCGFHSWAAPAAAAAVAAVGPAAEPDADG